MGAWASQVSADEPAAAVSPRVRVYEAGDVVRVDVDGVHLTSYHYKDVSRPFLYPVIGPGGAYMTRRWPMEEYPDEEHDHPHHRSFWYSHGEVNGQDLWSESNRAGKTVHNRFVTLQSSDTVGVLTTRNEWRSKEGDLLGQDERTMRFYAADGDDRIMDFEIRIDATAGDLVLGDTKEGTFALRVAESMRAKQPRGREALGTLINSRGDKNGDAWAKRAEWADYSGPVDGKTVGVAIFDHPSNPRHPTWWHARDYGLFAANPFGVHDFEKKPKGEGDLKVSAGKSITFRYRVLLHSGDSVKGRVAERYDEFVREKQGN